MTAASDNTDRVIRDLMQSMENWIDKKIESSGRYGLAEMSKIVTVEKMKKKMKKKEVNFGKLGVRKLDI